VNIVIRIGLPGILKSKFKLVKEPKQDYIMWDDHPKQLHLALLTSFSSK
jgi:hypothetical protein